MIPIAKPVITPDEERAVLEVLRKGQLASGEYVTAFEEMLKKYLDCKYAVCTSSGTTALHSALLGAGIGKDDAVITTPFSFIATANTILYAGAVPLFADVDKETFNIDPDRIEALIRQTRKKIKAMVIVHLFGNPCHMDKLLEICDRYGIILIEDCAQAIGAEYRGKKAGTFGKAAAFSFYPTKNITCGEGGAVVTDDEELFEKVKKLVNHGQSGKYKHDILGYNFRMTNIAAAIGIEQLKKLESFNIRRRLNAAKYFNGLNEERFILPKTDPANNHTFNQYTLKCKSARSHISGLLREHDIGYGIYYPSTIPQQPVYKKKGLYQYSPDAEALCQEVLSIPVHPLLSDKDIDYIIDILNGLR